MSSALRQTALPTPKPGERWVRVTERGQGLVVEILRVTPLNVQFRVARGRDSNENRHSLKLGYFMANYAPAEPEHVRARQERLRAIARNPGLVGQGVPSEPKALPPPSHVTISDNGVATCTCAEFVDRYASNDGYICDHIRRSMAMQAQDEPPGDAAVATEPEGARAPQAGGRPRLTDAQVLDILEWRGVGNAKELAAYYGVSETTIYKIWRGETHRHLAAASKGDATQQPVIEPTPPPRRLLQERKVESRRIQGRYYSVRVFAGGIVECSCTGFKNDGTCWHARAVYGDEDVVVGEDQIIRQRPEPQIEEAPVAPVAPTPLPTPPTTVLLDDSLDAAQAVDARAIMREMADYLEVLAEYAGRPLPKLFKLDAAEVQRIVSLAREFVGG